ncbi:uncharacterized protein LOC109606616 [Aethina tumida]|uniref:uncharacterized protein LOC109606616 n=1 Tax=Aethina tumida TaxID=116153 RepID=UPI0021486F78|nr:uncharacterized protein LOC109606616 [Aethina tumida]
MVHVNGSKENFIESLAEKSDEELREERRRTGRYLAMGIAIFIVTIGLYQAVAQGATKYATLLGTVLIMFLYLLWLLYAAQRKGKLLKVNEEIIKKTLEESKFVQHSQDNLNVPFKSNTVERPKSSHEIHVHVYSEKEKLKNTDHSLNRTYSVA